MAELLDEIHPGEILLEDFLITLNISARRLASDIDVSPSRISDLVNGHRPITADTALRLGLFFNMEPRFWLNLQSAKSRSDPWIPGMRTPRLESSQPACAPETPG
jgi:addiction module HigA family antidote